MERSSNHVSVDRSLLFVVVCMDAWCERSHSKKHERIFGVTEELFNPSPAFPIPVRVNYCKTSVVNFRVALIPRNVLFRTAQSLPLTENSGRSGTLEWVLVVIYKLLLYICTLVLGLVVHTLVPNCKKRYWHSYQVSVLDCYISLLPCTHLTHRYNN